MAIEVQGGAATSKARGDRAEQFALDYLQLQGLRLLRRNFRTPGRGGGEIDLIMRERDGTLVFVEVRQRRSNSRGGAGASIGATKQRRIVHAARHFLARLATEPRCRFDALLIDGDLDAQPAVEWLRGAFDAG